ncbi:hypothetical protein G7076_06380 [Sphingomonas sp. HDW15A]|uniref:hypothetical protein n=1 Tax=Sphingomonas sp. HDW15A TaxID=2714942 RepID=UPI001408B4C1|nr:hypothetical protein [Sphingomonas sp. HDW15A]QIK96124.1 hypothetical protein G7076_06380 [Sphingomonas sp. HDW15A]
MKTLDGREICVPIYREVDIWRKPDPRRAIFDDIRTLATINEGIRTIADERIRKAMFEAVQGAAKLVELPEGVKLGDELLKSEKAFMAAK